jgi:predicted alpha/beta superfamily hydrolase
VRRLQVQGGAGTSKGQVRDLLVWLPPGYDDDANAGVRYPVLYMHDGQNLFEKLPTVPGEWRADETATELIQSRKVRPMIIVGVPHSGAGRMSEYLPVAALDGVEPQGEAHVRWLLTEVMPRVERTFRVAAGPENTGVGGSSLGAAIGLYAATQHPEVFGKALLESLPLRSGRGIAWDDLLGSVRAWPGRTYLGMGGNETGPEADKDARNQEYVDAVKALQGRISTSKGSESVMLMIDQDAVHNEEAWAARFPKALEYLFPAQ